MGTARMPMKLCWLQKTGYPVLVRPSYVLGGQKMRIVINDEGTRASCADDI